MQESAPGEQLLKAASSQSTRVAFAVALRPLPLRQRSARHPPAQAELRMRLAANRHTHRLFDMASYARDFAAALERVWVDHAAGTPV